VNTISNPTIELIKNHRSIRRYKDKPINEELFEQLMVAGQSASTSSTIQAVSVIRVQDIESRSLLVELTGNQKYVATASEFLVFCADLNRNFQRIKESAPDADFEWTEQFLSSTIDVALFAQNVVIAAESNDLGCCYIGGIRNNPEQVIELLKLPDLVFPLFGLCIGYPDQDPEKKPRLPIAVQVHKNHYTYTQNEVDLIDEYDETLRQYYLQRTSGKLQYSWSEQMLKQSRSENRPFIKKSINNKGLALK